MTGVLAAAARAVLAAVLVLAAATAVFWAWVRPAGELGLLAMSVTIIAAALGVPALRPRKGGGDG